MTLLWKVFRAVRKALRWVRRLICWQANAVNWSSVIGTRQPFASGSMQLGRVFPARRTIDKLFCKFSIFYLRTVLFTGQPRANSLSLSSHPNSSPSWKSKQKVCVQTVDTYCRRYSTSTGLDQFGSRRLIVSLWLQTFGGQTSTARPPSHPESDSDRSNSEKKIYYSSLSIFIEDSLSSSSSHLVTLESRVESSL